MNSYANFDKQIFFEVWLCGYFFVKQVSSPSIGCLYDIYIDIMAKTVLQIYIIFA